MKLNKWLFVSAGALSVIPTAPANAIEVFPIVKEIRQETPRENYISVKSGRAAGENQEIKPSDAEQYEFVTMELFYVPNPGETKETRIKATGSDDPELIFSPSKLIVPYGEYRKVRLMPLKDVDHEKIYRLRIRPSYPEQEMDKGKVRFAVGYDVMLRYLPAGRHTQGISLSCEGKKWTINATGNVRSELHNLVIDGRKDRQTFNVYPDYARSLNVSKRLSFEFEGKQQAYEGCERKV